MAEEVKFWIKGTLPRGRHLAYQGILMVLSIIAFAINPESKNIMPDLIIGAVSWYFLVKRLHDAGHSGAWSFPIIALWIVALVVTSDYYINNYLNDKEVVAEGFFGLGNLIEQAERQRTAGTAGIFAWIGNLVGFIVICALPTKADNNPYKPS